jgi:hypothetical protein
VTATATRLPRAPASGVPTVRLASQMPAHSATATASSSGSRRTTADAPTPTASAAPPATRNPGSDSTAEATPSSWKPRPVSREATSVPGASTPQGTATNPSRASTAAWAGRKPIRRSNGVVTIAPTPKPVTDSTNGVTPRTTSSTSRPRSCEIPASQVPMRCWAPPASSSSASSRPPRTMAATSTPVSSARPSASARRPTGAGMTRTAAATPTSRAASAARTGRTRASSSASATAGGAAARTRVVRIRRRCRRGRPRRPGRGRACGGGPGRRTPARRGRGAPGPPRRPGHRPPGTRRCHG